MTILTPQDRMRIRQAMALGLARQPLTPSAAVAPLLAAASPGTDPTRVILALASQRQRFERPTPLAIIATPAAAAQLHADSRPIVPPPLRRALTRLSNAVAKGQAGLALQSAVARIVSAGLRPHPFDLPWLMPHIKSDNACLGLAERAYLALTEKSVSSERTSILHATITAQNWTDFPKAHRREFLARQRVADPAAARVLLESNFKSEPAPVRCELLDALNVRLSTDDLPFLESLTDDRADSVKAVAARLLARVPGTPPHAARITEAAACFQMVGDVKSWISQFGLGRSGAVTFVAPKGSISGQSAATQRVAATAALFDGLTLDDLATATGLTDPQLLAALDDDETVIGVLMESARSDADAATHAVLFDHKVRALVQAANLHANTLIHLHDLTRSPMPAPTAEHVLASPAWAGLIARLTVPDAPSRDDGAILFAAMLMPSTVMPRFLATIEPIQLTGAREARAYADLVLAIPAQSSFP
jgi:Family of unknown function (DUF5691)